MNQPEITIVEAQQARDSFERGSQERAVFRMLMLGMRTTEILQAIPDMSRQDVHKLVDEAFPESKSVRPHDLRKLFTWTLIDNGLNIRTTNILSDHLTAETTMLSKKNRDINSSSEADS